MSDRHDRVVSLIRELAAAFIQAEANPNPLITVTQVTTSPDYKKVTIYVTTIPEGRENDAIVFLTRHASDLRYYLKKKSNLKHIPHLTFAVDHGERHRQHIDELSREIDKK